ncbi:hypothetical protein QQF64_031284 [Cirrhinus molitorella]|uniref:Reverse transcriptase RNase H-like domain-containing protein n=1 Tax=Cirrhinus molitorella TaxID=172907 RepID=A0ABR3MWL2_9TELE
MSSSIQHPYREANFSPSSRICQSQPSLCVDHGCKHHWTWGMHFTKTGKFSDYLYGGEFTVITDSNPLTYILTSAKLDATSYRWLSSLSMFNFKIQYRAGKRNLDADGLLRRPHDRPLDDFVSQKECERIKQFTLHHLAESGQPTILPAAVKALCERHQVYQSCGDSDLPCSQPTVFESLSLSVFAIPQEFQQEGAHGLPILPQMSKEELKEHQRADPELKEVIKYLESGKKPDGRVQPAEVASWLESGADLSLRTECNSEGSKTEEVCCISWHYLWTSER